MNWRAIPEWDGRYEVSDKGEVRSIDRRVDASNGRTNFIRGQYLKSRAVLGYPQVKLRRPGQAWHVKVHTLVLLAFVGPRPDGEEARHLNGDRTDNRLENLRWGTKLENGADKAAHCSSKGVNHGRHKLTAFQAFMVQESPAHIKHAELAAQLGVTSASISCIRRGINWGWL